MVNSGFVQDSKDPPRIPAETDKMDKKREKCWKFGRSCSCIAPRFTQIEYANAPPRVQKNTPLSIREVM